MFVCLEPIPRLFLWSDFARIWFYKLLYRFDNNNSFVSFKMLTDL